jgi:hypothetical protein
VLREGESLDGALEVPRCLDWVIASLDVLEFDHAQPTIGTSQGLG